MADALSDGEREAALKIVKALKDAGAESRARILRAAALLLGVESYAK